jgi:hypothetical protein
MTNREILEKLEALEYLLQCVSNNLDDWDWEPFTKKVGYALKMFGVATDMTREIIRPLMEETQPGKEAAE